MAEARQRAVLARATADEATVRVVAIRKTVAARGDEVAGLQVRAPPSLPPPARRKRSALWSPAHLLNALVRHLLRRRRPPPSWP